ncbi:integrase family protein [Solidesulfovibrio fructosivorans JJ]]|uniref:Integrase family protein n=1 Tax=Solidesulfovibrio fructosivorans JJ] TaxID=596151 RepID=E1JUL4_SOLFR|nr:site-specific integrase [Solidesulfovibrio fructosivorans]EFL52144.1 integrase family protein [Solidesulfovibrio fructosivorans JJ]]
MATIRPRGDSWEVRIRRKGWPVTCRTFDTKFDAEKWAREIESEMDRGVFVSRAEAEATTLAEALDRYETDYLPRLAHPDREILRIKGLKRRVLAARFLAAIRTKDVADFIKEREAEGVSPNTIRLDLALLSRLFEVAASDWGMESLANPVRRVSRPKLPSGRTRRLEAGEEEKLLDACPSPFKELIQLALETAMRREELQTLEWSQVDFNGKTAHLPKTKNGDARTVPLSPIALDILQSIQRGESDRIFPFTLDFITKKMGKVVKKAGMVNFHFHDLRHEATSRLFENTDLDVMEIKGITGHKSMQMLARYSHLRAGRLAERLAGKGRK